MNSASFACLAAVLGCLGGQAATAAPRKAEQKEVLVPCGNLFGAIPPAPLRHLCAALRQHPRARLFRVTWNSDASLGSSSQIALYDRSRKSLKPVSSSSWHIDGGKSTEMKKLLDEWLYTDVSEAKLQTLRLKHSLESGDASESEDALLGQLPRLRELGCRERHLRHLARSHRHKY